MRKYLLAIFCLILPLSQRAESFRSYTPRDGLSHCTTLFSAQDGDGRMWFGTEDGLSSFDGYSFRVYRNDKSDPTTVPGDRISSIEVCSNGDLWVSAGKKIARYDRLTDCFTSWEHPSLGRQVRNIFEISEGKMGVTYEGQLWCFDIEKQQFETESLPSELVNVSLACCCAAVDRIALGMQDGSVVLWKKSGGALTALRALPGNLKLRCLLLDGKDLWIGTEGEGLLCADLESGEVVHHCAGDGGLSSDFVRALCFDSDHRLWVGSYQGLDILQAGKFSHFRHDAVDKHSLEDNSIRTITRDNQGGMWIGSFYGGVNYWHKSLDRFCQLRAGGYNFAEKGLIQGMAEDMDGNIWMGVDYQTVVRFDPLTEAVAEYTVQGFGGSPLSIKAFHFDGSKVYLCTRLAGMIVLDSEDGSFISTDCDGLAGNISCLLPKDSDNLYIGTPGGVLLYNKSSSRASRIPAAFPKSINCMLRDESGMIWVGGNGGVARFEDRDGDLVQVGIDDNISKLRKLRRIFQTSTGDLYFCADRFCHYSPASGAMEIFSVADGLPTNLVSNIIEDGLGRLWLFTANGICCHIPETKLFKQYSGDDGLIFSGFGSSSICKTAEGQVYVGSKDGIMTFKPEEIDGNPFSPTPVISSIGNDGRRFQGDVVLERKHNTVTFEFNTFNYLSAGGDEFSFKLEGYDSDYRSQKGINTVSYYNIPPGKYRLVLRSANNDGVPSPETAVCSVIVKPSFLATPLAIGVYVLLGLLALLLLFLKFRRPAEVPEKEVQEIAEPLVVNEDERFIEGVNAVINGHLEDAGLSINDIVREIGMSRSSFYLKLKSLTGLSPQDYIRKIRLSEACRMLLEDKKSIAEIAELTGFCTASYFSRAFKSYYGVLPSKYRSQNEKK